MTIKECLSEIGINSTDLREVKGVSFDSRNVEDGDIFIAYKGEHCDGNDYICEAFNKGAVCVISDRLVGYDIYKSDNIHIVKHKLSKMFYNPKKIKIIGITGTNGKTSSAFLTYQSLTNMGVSATYIGTLGVIDKEYQKIIDNTTPDIDVLLKEINKAYLRKCEYVVMEVSSHSLSMNRVSDLDFDLVAFTNFSQDHLDYYGDMESYFNAKKLLFDNAKKHCIGVINNEDKMSREIIKDFKGKVVKYGKNSEYEYRIIKNNIQGLKFKINDNVITTKLIYKMNVYNLLLAYTILSCLKFKEKDIVNALNNVDVIKGRMEVVTNREKTVIIDYAHTPDAFERILKETNKIKKGKLSVLFGCGGNRDRLKRPIMGRIVAKYADDIYISNDNPRDEDPNIIINDILKGIKNKNYIIELDREVAIKKAINNLEKDDVLLVLGKGHEEYQIIGQNKKNLSDKEIAKRCLGQ